MGLLFRSANSEWIILFDRHNDYWYQDGYHLRPLVAPVVRGTSHMAGISYHPSGGGVKGMGPCIIVYLLLLRTSYVLPKQLSRPSWSLSACSVGPPGSLSASQFPPLRPNCYSSFGNEIAIPVLMGPFRFLALSFMIHVCALTRPIQVSLEPATGSQHTLLTHYGAPSTTCH